MTARSDEIAFTIDNIQAEEIIHNETLDLIKKYNPFVLDAGSVFVDSNTKHSFACGWLAVYHGLRFLHYINRLPHTIQLNQITPKILKTVSGCTTSTLSIRDAQLTKLAKFLNIRIRIPRYESYGCDFEDYSGDSPLCNIYLWLHLGHYTFWITEQIFIPQAQEFIKGTNLTCYHHDPNCQYQIAPDTSCDHLIALALQGSI